MTAPSSFKFSLQSGAGGTWVECTSDVLFEEGPINYTDARTSQFDGFSPGTFPLTLNNSTGKYTPNNPASTLAVPLSEGMGVCMELAGVLFSGTIRSAVLVFPPLESASKARVRITTDDMLGNAARHEINDLRTTLFDSAGGFFLWPFTDVAGSPIAAEQRGGVPLISVPEFPATFGVTGTPITASSVAALTINTADLVTHPHPLATLPMGTETVGALGAWIAFGLSGGGITVTTSPAPGAGDRPPPFGFHVTGAGTVIGDLGGSDVTGPTVDITREHYISVEVATTFSTTWTYTLTLWVDGVSYGTVVDASADTLLTDVGRTPRFISVGSVPAGTMYVSRLSFSRFHFDEYGTLPATAAVRLATIAATAPEITLDTLPAGLSTAIMGTADLNGVSTLDAMNEIMRAEQGYMWSETTGTLTAPVEKIKIAARDRERAVDYTFDVSEILDPIPLIHSLTNTVSEATANGPETSATYQDASLVPLVGSASTSDSVPLRDYNPLYGYASDRVVRGINLGVAITSITVDATSPRISRWADLTAIRQGYVLAITGLPSAQLNYDTWHGYVVGREINSTQDSATDEPKTFFTFYLAPRTPVAVYDDADTARFAAGGTLSLTSNITNSATSISVTSTGVLFTTTGGHFPQDIRIGNEVITISGVTGGSSPQTFTASVRGAVDPLTGLATTAAAHTAGDNVELAQPALYAY